jgi:branched-subunit amino acid aminotransferase/4-amino-4-deoxychorismate lyase
LERFVQISSTQDTGQPPAAQKTPGDTTYVCCNGEIIPAEAASLPAADRGLLYGYGLFETFMVKKGRAVFVEEHLQRLSSSAPKLGLLLSEEDCQTGIINGINRVIEKNCLQEGSLRLTVTAGSESERRPGILITVKKAPAYRSEHYQQGFRAGFLKNPRNERSPLVYLKSLNYLENLLGRQEAISSNWNEGLFLNTHGCLAEGTVSNIFLVTGDKELVTPHVSSGLLPGVMRAKVLRKAAAAGYRCRERAVLPEELFSAKECFLTNSLMVVMPLVEVDGKSIGDGKPGQATGEIRAGLEI